VLSRHTFKIPRKKGSDFFDHRGTLSEDVLVILGLTGPYRGSSHQFTKLCCFVIIMGLVTTSTNTQQQSPLNVLDGENACNDVSEALSTQFLGIGKKKNLKLTTPLKTNSFHDD